MASHQYKVVPYSVEIKKGDHVDKASEQLQSAIQEYVSQEWEFIQVANLSIKINDPPPLNWSTRYDSSGRTDNEYQTT